MMCDIACHCVTADRNDCLQPERRPSQRFNSRYTFGGRLGSYAFPMAYREAARIYSDPTLRAAAYDRITDAIRVSAMPHRYR